MNTPVTGERARQREEWDMGQEASCRVTFGTQTSEGMARLEQNELVFKGTFRLRIPFASISAFEAKNGELRVTFAKGAARFHLGPQAEKWALKIRYPKGRLDKLGIKPTSTVSVLSVEEDGFRQEVEGRAAVVSVGGARRNSDLIIVGITETSGLARLTMLREQITPTGAIWVVWPKGQKALREDDVRKAAVERGLVDVKVMSFSDTLSALKLMIPVAQRSAAGRQRAQKDA
jgi:hypothetical protein